MATTGKNSSDLSRMCHVFFPAGSQKGLPVNELPGSGWPGGTERSHFGDGETEAQRTSLIFPVSLTELVEELEQNPGLLTPCAPCYVYWIGSFISIIKPLFTGSLSLFIPKQDSDPFGSDTAPFAWTPHFS